MGLKQKRLSRSGRASDKPNVSYDTEVLSILIYEFSKVARQETDEKIAKRLQRKKLGSFDRARIEVLRKLKDELQSEILKGSRSVYYDGPTSRKEQMSRYVELHDFDIPQMTIDAVRRYPKIPKPTIRWFVPFSVFVNYLL